MLPCRETVASSHDQAEKLFVRIFLQIVKKKSEGWFCNPNSKKSGRIGNGGLASAGYWKREKARDSSHSTQKKIIVIIVI